MSIKATVIAAAKRANVSLDDLLRQDRRQPLASVRQETYALLWINGSTVSEIARFFARDHRTISEGIDKVIVRFGQHRPKRKCVKSAVNH